MSDSVSITSNQPAVTAPPREWTVRFYPDGADSRVRDGQTLQQAAAAAGAPLDHPCGGRGICGKCRVRVTGDAGSMTTAEEKLLSGRERDDGCRLSCQASVRSDLEVHLENTDSLDVGEVLLEGAGGQIALQPRCRKTFVELTPPTLTDSIDDEQRLRNALGDAGAEVRPLPRHLIERLPGVLRECNFAVTVTALDDDAISVEPGDTRDRFLGAAVDVGTTTVAVSLHDLRTGAELGRRGMANKQITCGADVISRMSYAAETGNGAGILQRMILETIQTAIDELCAESGVSARDIYHIAAVGNSVMQTLLLGIDPGPIAVSPFIVSSTRSLDGPASETGFNLHPSAVLTTAPSIASYVGGDIVADILASEIYEHDKPTLLIDIGTNAEIVLADRRRILACASPAGPAFEGAEIRQGMRAAHGAIERVSIGRDCFEIQTIGGGKPRGLCGSGLIDSLACLLEVGAVDDRGRLLPKDEYKGADWVKALIGQDENGERITLWTDGTDRICLWAQDIRKLQLAKGAVKSGIKILCHHWGIAAAELAGILMAGAFGSHLTEESIIRIGMVPELPGRPVRYIGNTAWVGAKSLLLTQSAAFRADEIRRQTRYHELSAEPGFQMEFGMSMLFDDNWEYFGLES